MPVNPHSYPHEKIGNGLRSLMAFGMPPEERIQAALVELRIAYGHNTPSGRALEPWNRIQQIIGHGSYPERAASMNASQREDFAAAYWDLDRAISADYWEVEHTR